MIIRENTMKVEDISLDYRIESDDVKYSADEMIFFDLEHYVYKKPKCIGVFGACVYSKEKKSLEVTQYMIENKYEVIDILHLAHRYFIDMKNNNKKAIVTFSGNNDFTVINYLFKKYSIEYNFDEEYDAIDVQKEYERYMGSSIGLKNLEKKFEIFREGEVISGSNLAKTFHKVLKDDTYIMRMPKEKIEKILLYNEQDVVNLYHILNSWKKYITPEIVETSNSNDNDNKDE
ncbi:ribonuclease H-like domain-containing protein [Clostridium sp. MSJ-8]|uniref:ribonuclease H-like domain-containing protein n=1 Tax=Clostridium sp. MSJ-8 TaxID=2841510 RepID=UPI001C0F2CDC|nr:ribonuclease H-like domain-containing protein [Clostridium sp. MSJ-8]